MTNLETELAHLVNLMAPPMREYWKSYCWAKAGYLAESNPADYKDLPRLLTEAMRPSTASPSTPPTVAE